MGKSLDVSKESTKSRQSSAKPSVQQQQQAQQRAARTTASTPAVLTDKEGKLGKFKRLLTDSLFEELRVPSYEVRSFETGQLLRNE